MLYSEHEDPRTKSQMIWKNSKYITKLSQNQKRFENMSAWCRVDRISLAFMKNREVDNLKKCTPGKILLINVTLNIEMAEVCCRKAIESLRRHIFHLVMAQMSIWITTESLKLINVIMKISCFLWDLFKPNKN